MRRTSFGKLTQNQKKIGIGEGDERPQVQALHVVQALLVRMEGQETSSAPSLRVNPMPLG
jgi:hypothetical protein